jgi:uncharacterized protein YqgC (DUF456 family)
VTTEQIIGLVVALLIMGVGAAGSVLPGIPSTPLVFLAAVIHRLCFGQHGPSFLVLAVLLLLMVISLAMDYAASVIGARKLGATWRGVVGALLGTIVGLFFALPGIILGPFIGAALLEWAGGRHWKQATRAGLGAVLGLFLGALGKLACCLAMIALFAVSVILNSGASKSSELPESHAALSARPAVAATPTLPIPLALSLPT